MRTMSQQDLVTAQEIFTAFLIVAVVLALLSLLFNLVRYAISQADKDAVLRAERTKYIDSIHKTEDLL